jgi:hypothetical protein
LLARQINGPPSAATHSGRDSAMRLLSVERPFTWTATADEILAKVRLTQLNIKKLVANNTK